MSDKTDIEKIADVLEMKVISDAYIRSSNRSRYIIIVIVFASVLAFIAHCNSMQNSWINNRYRVASYALNHEAWKLWMQDKKSLSTLCKLLAMNKRGPLSIDTLLKAYEQKNLDAVYDNCQSKKPELDKISFALHDLCDSFKLKVPILTSFDRLFICLGKKEKTLPTSIDSLFSLFTFFKKNKIKKLELFDIDSLTLDSLGCLVDSFKVEQDLLNSAIQLCEYRQIIDSIALLRYIEDLDRARTEKVMMIHVPILGIMLDINHLGFLGGFAFTVILLWFRFGLWKELSNLKMVFRHASEKKKLPDYYQHLIMWQVLSVPQTQVWWLPRSLLKRRFKKKLNKIIPSLFYIIFTETPYRLNSVIFSKTVVKILFFLPLIVQFLVLRNDYLTYQIGEITSKSSARLGLITGSFWFVLIFIFTWRCFSLLRDIDSEWDRVFKKLYGKKGDENTRFR